MAFLDNRNGADVIDVNPNVDLDCFTLHDLLKLKGDIERRLPARSIKDINLSQELVLQFLAAQELQNEVLRDAKTAANQKAQVANSVAAILGQIAKLQQEIYTTERLKTIEAKLIEAINSLPNAVQEQFFEVYEALLEA